MADPVTMLGAGQAAYGIGSGINSTIKGSQAARQAESGLTNFENQAGDLVNMAGDAFNQIGGFAQNPLGGFGQGVMNQINGLGGVLGGIANDTQQSLMQQAMGQYQGPDFAQLDQIQEMAQQNALDFGDRARTTALENSALAFDQGADQLNAMLADRGIAGGSGVAAGALGDLARAGAQSRVELNRGLADQQQQAALGAAQFDVNAALQRGGLDLSAANIAFQNNLAGNQFNSGLIMQGADLQRDAALTPIQMQQGFLTQNIQQPQLGALGLLNPAGLFGAGIGALGDINALRQRQVENAGGGKGASTGMATGGFDMMGRGKGAAPGMTTTGGGGGTYP